MNHRKQNSYGSTFDIKYLKESINGVKDEHSLFLKILNVIVTI